MAFAQSRSHLVGMHRPLVKEHQDRQRKRIRSLILHRSISVYKYTYTSILASTRKVKPERIFRPFVPRIASRKFAANLWIVALPEARKVRRNLQSALIG